MSKPIIEKAKSICLVVLFLSTVLLLCFFWGNISFDSIKSQQEVNAEEIPDITYMIKPDQIVVTFGANNYTVIAPGNLDVWYNSSGAACMAKEIGRFGRAENILVEEITYAQYQEVMQFRSILAEFAYDIPMADFFQNYQIKKPSNYDVIETVTAIGYSTASEKHLFVYDGKNHKYYRLVADVENADFEALIASIEAKDYNSYNPISAYMGIEVENKTLIPVEIKTNLRTFLFRQESYSYQTEKINAIAENFFGRNMDFVRTITEDSGTVIYMYSYAKNVLIVNTDGSIEYKEEQTSDTEQSFLEALETAVQFVARHGSWESRNGAKLTPYLKDVSLNPNKKKGFRFTFGMEANGNRLFYEKGDPIVIDVTSGQVTYYKRNMIDFDQEDLETIETYSAEAAFSPVNLIANNYEYLYHILETPDDKNMDEDQFKAVATAVNKMQIGYVRMADEGITEIYPVWMVLLNNTKVYFNLYSAEPIGYTKE